MSPEAFSIKKLKQKLWKNYTLFKTDHDYKAFKEDRNMLRCLRIHEIWGFIMNNIMSLLLEGALAKSFWHYII